MKYIFLTFALFNSLFASALITEDVVKQDLNGAAIFMFFIFVLTTLGITFWASRQTKSASDFYTAGGGISGFKNGLAIAGDYMSAASFLGISGAVYLNGFDGLIFAIGFLVGWPIILFLIAEPLRNLGKFTFADVTAYRLRQKPIRTLAASGSIATVSLYLIAQMVGSGKLIELLFGLDYEVAVVLVGTLMILYVTVGGMLATTWVQIIKAFLLLSGATFMAVMVLGAVDFNFEQLFVQAIEKHPKNEAIMAPGGFITDAYSAISLAVALMLGTAGLPHILMRFFTVGNAKEARKSVFFATGFIGYFYILTFIIGFGAILMVYNNPLYLDFAKQAISGGQPLLGGKNMAAIHLSHALGGDLFLGFISAVAFATILAVVSGLTLAGASAISHDLYASVFGKNVTEAKEMRVSKIATIVLGIIAIGLGMLFEEQNIAFMVALAFAIAASANFPVLFLSIKWSRLTTRGATIGGSLGLFTAIMLVILGPTVWVDILGNKEAIFPSKYPALISVSVAFITIIIISLLDKSESATDEIVSFEAQYLRSMTGIGAQEASKH